MSKEILEELEAVWRELLDSPTKGRTFYLTLNGKIVFGSDAERKHRKLEEIGTYTRAVTLCQFRDDVLEAWDAILRKNHG